MGGKIIISPVSGAAARKAIRAAGGAGFGWAYLGEDVSKLIFLEKAIGTAGKHIEMAGMLQGIAGELRGPYIEYIGKLSRENNSLAWWAGRLSEKNPFVSKAFLHACYARVCIDLAGERQEIPLIFFVEKRAVRQSILKNLPQAPRNMESIWEPAAGIMDDIWGLFVHKAWFLFYNIYRIIISKYVYGIQKKIRAGAPLVLVHTFIDQRSFGENSAYHESYFGKLAPYLEKNGQRVAMLPQIWRTVPYQKTMRDMKNSEYAFLVPHAFLSIFDILEVLFATLPGMHKRITFPAFEKMDISDIMKDDMKNDWKDNHVALALLYRPLFRRLKDKNIRIDTMIYTYENHAWEKVLCSSVREFHPAARLVGYQHAVFSMMSLSHFFSRDEAGIMPFPDRVVTNGRHFHDVLIKSGYPADRVVAGGAIKYTSLLEQRKMAGRHKRKKPVILVTPTVGKTSIEMITKVFGAFRRLKEYEVVIRCHPVVPVEMVKECLDFDFPPHMRFSSRPFSELLEESDILIYASSATCLEAIAAGVPAVHVQSDLSLDLDPLDGYPEARISVRDEAGLAEAVEKLLGMGEEEYRGKLRIWKGISGDFFGRADDSAFKLFIRNKTNKKTRMPA
jgi:hypothetical protein